MGINKREGLGIGTAAAGGAAAGSVFGPFGAAAGGLVGGVGGLIGGLTDNPEEDLEKRRQAQKEQLLLSVLRNRAAELGAPTTVADTQMALKDIDNQYDQGMAGIDDIGTQDVVNLASNVAAVGANAKKWGNPPSFETDDVEVPISDKDVYGSEQKNINDFHKNEDGLFESRARRRFS